MRRAAPSSPAAGTPVPADAGVPGRPRADALLRRLEWTSLRRLDGLLQGDYQTLWRGDGLDLADLREYQVPDDVRHIDWNVTARLDHPHVRLFTADRDLSAWFALDLSASLDLGSGLRRKLDVVAEFVALLARVLTRHGNRVGALFYGQKLEGVLPARSGREQVLHLLHRLQTRPAVTGERATDLGELLREAASVVRRRSLVFVVSDFISLPGWETALGRLAQRHEVVAVRITDPIDRQGLDLGLVMLQDAETGEQMLVDTRDRGFRERYALQSAEREAALLLALARAGVDTLELSTAEPPEAALLRFMALRRLRVRMSRGGARPRDLHAAGVAPA